MGNLHLRGSLSKASIRFTPKTVVFEVSKGLGPNESKIKADQTRLVCSSEIQEKTSRGSL